VSAVDASAPTAEVIAARGVRKTFGAANGGLLALDDVSLSVREGQFVTMVGPSGCGKSTLLQILAGLVPASSGEVLIDGERMTGPRPDKIGLVFQEPLLLPWKTAAENVEFPLSLHGEKPGPRRERAQALLELVGLRDFSHAYPHELSGGMKQRVAIARGLVRNPRIVLMDEPFAALDEQTRTRMWSELLQIWARSRSTVLFVTHGLVEAIYLADVVLVMGARPGRIIERIEVNLPRPRTLDMVGSEALGQLRNRIWHLIADPQT
jgi:NitT/TauT family transport system ATP-binding protein